jgi:hypothetical protein
VRSDDADRRLGATSHSRHFPSHSGHPFRSRLVCYFIS